MARLLNLDNPGTCGGLFGVDNTYIDLAGDDILVIWNVFHSEWQMASIFWDVNFEGMVIELVS